MGIANLAGIIHKLVMADFLKHTPPAQARAPILLEGNNPRLPVAGTPFGKGEFVFLIR
jgi:hypothetical protein